MSDGLCSERTTVRGLLFRLVLQVRRHWRRWIVFQRELWVIQRERWVIERERWGFQGRL